MNTNRDDCRTCSDSNQVRKLLENEEKIRERIDNRGDKWIKVYFGSGAHYRNWLDQIIEIYGDDNVEIEEVKSCELKCFKEDGEKAYRIWAIDKT